MIWRFVVCLVSGSVDPFPERQGLLEKRRTFGFAAASEIVSVQSLSGKLAERFGGARGSAGRSPSIEANRPLCNRAAPWWRRLVLVWLFHPPNFVSS